MVDKETQKILKTLAHVAVNSSVVISKFSPFVSYVARFGKTYFSFRRGGFYNPALYANGAAVILTATSLGYNALCLVCPTILLYIVFLSYVELLQMVLRKKVI
jgi:spore coat polysaccharide biosynthesis predicted glycosyltransferase SpsG